MVKGGCWFWLLMLSDWKWLVALKLPSCIFVVRSSTNMWLCVAVSFVVSKNIFRPLLGKVGAWDLVCWLYSEIKGVDKKKPYIWIFSLLISQLLNIGSLKFLCLPHIIRVILCGVGIKILKIRCIEAEIWAKQKFKCKAFFINTL